MRWPKRINKLVHVCCAVRWSLDCIFSVCLTRYSTFCKTEHKILCINNDSDRYRGHRAVEFGEIRFCHANDDIKTVKKTPHFEWIRRKWMFSVPQRNGTMDHTQVVVWERSEPVSVQFHIMSLLGVPSTHVHRRLFFVFVFLPSSVTILWIFAFYRMFRNGEAHKKLKTEPNNLHWPSTTTTAVQMVRYDEFMVHGSWKWYISYTTNITHIFEVNNMISSYGNA